jgi:hypothetical protein
VPVYRPVRGVIDLVLVDARPGDVIGGEAHSEIRQAERQLRWAAEKADALPSATGWPWIDAPAARVSRLLIVRNSAAMRELTRTLPETFRAAYPGRTAEAVASLTGEAAWPGRPAIAWVDVRGTASRLLAGPPRGVAVGR